ncbi:hypothetical protein KAFR_0E04420 [Kazachstania africana CBS 2517]|uniref:Vacuolar membrane-associated protein IML1 n=1 Tax=Kazachstania africana (strain ATCC 22294 / BCRC 22015 / CBS 2517 / CECT 1963 / NBRC 1671 / NRRL Y-8276) TaxID=1071382 RepID=H2AW42_KAZAF|nr:hypothetical protein KAFR_0E04420 [Kazachstania africana CBS 2517]CCF58592.1 hypothetical protein KAFR_0E04420 [Kazachstania africana CBS 2517]
MSNELFASLRAKNTKEFLIPPRRAGSPRIANTTNTHSISLSSGNLVVGSPKNLQILNNTLKIQRTKNSHLNSSRAKQYNSSTIKIEDSSHDAFPQLDDVGDNTGSNHNNDELENTIHNKTKCHQLELSYHEAKLSNEMVALNLDDISDIEEGDLCELKVYNKHSSKDHAKMKIYFIAKDYTGELKTRSQKNKSNISISFGQLQSLLDLPPMSKLVIKKKSKDKVEADLVEINVKDCSLNRGDMWWISSQLVDSCLFSGQKLVFLDSIRGTVKGIYRDGKKVLAGYVGEKTRVVFRSESARLIFLIQITEEMWNFEETGEQMFQKMINSFFPKIFKKWKTIDTHHTITVAFAISMDFSDYQFKDLKPGEKLKNPKDHFRIVVDQVNIIDWVKIMDALRKEFSNLRSDLLNIKTDKGFSVIQGRFAPVIKSNILELVNFATTILADPFRQVDLRHTTTHVMIVTAGSGLYDVDYNLLNSTGRKLLSLEMTMDLICLSRAPLHVVPLFRYQDYELNLHHCIPNWLSIFFWNDSTKESDQWHPRCKVYNLQMMGLTDNEIMEQAELSTLNIKPIDRSVTNLIKDFDQAVFTHPGNQRIPSLDTDERTKVAAQRSMNDEHKLARKKSNLLWDAPKYSEPVVEVAQKFEAVADIYSHNKIEELSNKHTQKHRTPNITEPKFHGSLALDSLKGLTKKNSMKDFTRRMLSRIAPSRASSNSMKYENDTILSQIDSANSPRKIAPQPIGTSGASHEVIEGVAKLSKNETNSQQQQQQQQQHHHHHHENNDVLTLIQDNSSLHPSFSTESSKKSTWYSRRPFAQEALKFKINEHVYVTNEKWVEIKNPSVPVSIEMADQLLPIRWKDVWPRYVAKKYSKWRSFTTPAELPITLSVFPSKEDFEENFIFRNHSVTLNIEQEAYNLSNEDLLRNMIYMRLVTGFQLCVGKQVDRIEQSKEHISGDVSVAKYIERRSWNTLKIYMMIDSEIHRISCEQNGVIDVQRYLRKEDTNPFSQVSKYTPLIRTRYETTYRPSKIDPIHTNRDSLNWNQIDQVLAGYGDYLMEKNWHGFRSKFVVLPSEIPPSTHSLVINGKNETLTPEELRVEGLRRLISSITKSRLKTEEERKRKSKNEEIQPEVTFYTGPFFKFINERQKSLEEAVSNFKDPIFISDKGELEKNMEISKLAHSMQYGENNLALVTRKWHWKKYENCFIGSEMVSWLVSNVKDVDTRDDAITFGQDLMNKGLFSHALNNHSFLDGHYFYQISPEYIVNSRQLKKINTDKTDLSDHSPSLKKVSSESVSEPSSPLVLSKSNTSYVDQEQGTEPKKRKVVLSNSVLVDVDPNRRSYKLETCTVHYDRVHNPEHCFHIRLEWLTTTPKLIDDLIANWSRVCERYGLNLVEMPWEELCSIPSTDPFHSFVEIPLAIDPWTDPEFNDYEITRTSKFYFHIYLLKKSGFILDNRASKILQEGKIDIDITYSWGKPEFKYAQYIHNSGAYMAEIRENGGLFLAPNNMHISRTTTGSISKFRSSRKIPVDSQKIMLQFKTTCSSYQQLREIFLECKKNWALTNGIDEV